MDRWCVFLSIFVTGLIVGFAIGIIEEIPIVIVLFNSLKFSS